MSAHTHTPRSPLGRFVALRVVRWLMVLALSPVLSAACGGSPLVLHEHGDHGIHWHCAHPSDFDASRHAADHGHSHDDDSPADPQDHEPDGAVVHVHHKHLPGRGLDLAKSFASAAYATFAFLPSFSLPPRASFVQSDSAPPARPPGLCALGARARIVRTSLALII